MKKIIILLLILLASKICWSGQENIEELQRALQTAPEEKKIDILNRLSSSILWNKPDKSIEYAQGALELAQKLDSPQKEAEALNNIGSGFDYLSSYDRALQYFMNALKIYEEIGEQKGIAKSLNNIGLIYKKLNNFQKALEYYQKSLEMYRKIEDEEGIANSLTYIGNIHYHLKNYDKALTYFEKAIEIYERLNDKKGITFPLNNTGTIYMKSGEYEKALEYFKKSLEMSQEVGDKWGIANTSNNIGEVDIKLGHYDKALPFLQEALELARELGAKELVQDSYELIAELYKEQGNELQYLRYYKHYAVVKDSIFSEETNKNIADLQTKFAVEKKEMENKILQLNIERQRIFIYFSVGILIIVLIFTYSIIKEKKKSESLLLNILPIRVAQDLKKTGTTEPETFENVTVFFSDIVGFTKMSSELDPKFLIDELNEIFTAFDNIIEKNHCERIKTIGDAYLAVCGMPVENEKHGENILTSAIEIVDYLKKRNENSKIQWRVRIGIHSGEVVGGVVGVKKYIYDVFGDTINTANRMESNSEPMKINVSEITYKILHQKPKNFPKPVRFVAREPIEVKGKGEMMMYFAEMD